MKSRILSRILLPSVLAAGVGLSLSAFAGEDGGGRHGHGHGFRGAFGPHALQSLDLSDEQKTSIRALFESRREAGRSQRDSLDALRRSFDQATPGSAEYQTAAVQLAEAESLQARQRVQEMADLRVQVYGLLTDAQKAEYAQQLASRPERPQRADQR